MYAYSPDVHRFSGFCMHDAPLAVEVQAVEVQAVEAQAVEAQAVEAQAVERAGINEAREPYICARVSLGVRAGKLLPGLWMLRADGGMGGNVVAPVRVYPSRKQG